MEMATSEINFIVEISHGDSYLCTCVSFPSDILHDIIMGTLPD